MNKRCPTLRIHHPRMGALVFREAVSIFFHMPYAHREIARQVRQSLETYLHWVGPNTLTCYPDEHGYFQELDATGWEVIQHQLRDEGGGIVELDETPDEVSGYRFEYRGINPRDNATPFSGCTVAFWLPTEYLEEKGPGPVRELALTLGHILPFNSGHAGYSFNYIAPPPGFAELALRHPGIDHLRLNGLPEHLGHQVRSPHWLTFLGPPVLGELGGTEGLSTRLRTPGTTVQAMGHERAVVSLGEWPEAGDTTKGDTLPAYRELARVLEPWLYHRPYFGRDPREEAELRRWERRFLD
ncbi:type VI immunity family protein [Melittangium boletus]|uniref:DUF3396 domain-containing protein n=1 Tax=Melittangium boletus DSM 14713 TaxID=1294270 RepID=A0A250IBX8_9BACT|nr:type VI immunity family protein [Melittangium boletus]ATB29349.1 hypothetical protein MEBOL_002798 [Melittangium boletus DSM 14713]